MPDSKPLAGVLLPYYARTLERIRTDLDLSYRQMADVLGNTEMASLLTRGQSGHIDHTTLRAVELGRNWPRNPDAWAAAYGEVIERPVFMVWGEAFRDYAVATGAPEAAQFARDLGRMFR